MLRRQFVTGILMTIVLTVLLGFVYPLAVTGISQLTMSKRANGSLVAQNGKVVGSSLIGQNFTDKAGNPLPQYFQPRPSAAGANGYDAMASSGSNLGPSNPTLLDAVAKRVTDYRKLNGLASGVKVPVDAVTTSASGLDPQISVANARLQAARVASARNLSATQVISLIAAHTQGRQLGFLGEQTVNVVQLNLALDRLAPKSG
ncbi:MAG TPA: K(+)-transporting ATPase subunit C [Acidimicrobiia bacterium]|jgi:K+-transporting ATPase ATPase C chain|nr:K(+)-transporting ATPase subunit C [Acidimicrobiia bacterium]